MALDRCPECNEESLIKVPNGQRMRSSLGCMLHVADEHYFKCLKCGYKTDIVRINTALGDYFDLPWWKRLFKWKVL